jgi:hypothetical protein
VAKPEAGDNSARVVLVPYLPLTTYIIVVPVRHSKADGSPGQGDLIPFMWKNAVFDFRVPSFTSLHCLILDSFAKEAVGQDRRRWIYEARLQVAVTVSTGRGTDFADNSPIISRSILVCSQSHKQDTRRIKEL